MKNSLSKKLTAFFLLIALAFTAAGCSAQRAAVDPSPEPPPGKKTYKNLVVGFAQVGAESEWRTGNTRSIKETAEQLDVELIFADGQQKQENQIKAIRTFIA